MIDEQSYEKLAEIFRNAATRLQEQIGRKRMALRPLDDLIEDLKKACKEEDENEVFLFHLFFLNYYVNHIMNHIAGDSSYHKEDDIRKDDELKEYASAIAEGFQSYAVAIKENHRYEGLVNMPLKYLQKIRYMGGDRNVR